MLRICVTGGRDYRDAAHVDFILSAIWPFILGEGGARGADSLCAKWVWEKVKPDYEEAEYHIRTYKADWSGGHSGGPIRNRRMLDQHEPHALIAFPGGKGTADCVAAAHERGIPVWHV